MKKISFIVLLILIISCNSKSLKKTSLADKSELQISSELVQEKIINDTISYKSGANGLAEIELKIFPNQTFEYYMRIIPQPMENEDESIINSKGTWTENNSWIRMKFQNKEISLTALFDLNYADKNQFKLIDEKNVDLNITLDEIMIWGVLCEKIKE